MKRSPLLRFAAAACAFFAASSVAHATWSLILINTKTGEIGVAGATCLENDDLFKFLPVVQVGVGAGMTQGFVNPAAADKMYMWDALLEGKKPVDILDELKEVASGVGIKQWGMVDFDHAPSTWSGGGLGQGVGGVTGISGDLRYAVQGNVLAGPEVVLAAATALLSHPGDVSQKVMAAMEAARALGGDGRCSCTTGAPTSCGVPPPGFVKSAHAGFVAVARIGDPDGVCGWLAGCATGDYYLRLESTGPASAPDPVLEMQIAYDVWRAGLAGRPDHLLSTVSQPAALVADGQTATEVLVRLVDVDGLPLTAGGATLTVEPEEPATAAATAGAVVDNGDGTYTVPFVAGTSPGTTRFVIRADDGVVQATLYPFLDVEVDPIADLHAGLDQVSSAAGAEVPFTLNLGNGSSGHPYVLLGSISGTDPGISLGAGLVLPLNDDWFLHCTQTKAGSTVLPGSIGVLDAGGRAEARFVAGPGLLSELVGLRIDWAAVDYAGPLAVTGAVGFEVEP
ncbi:MAG: DUF1028 domain-containing protein [Planctomycetota bacterium]